MQSLNYNQLTNNNGGVFQLSKSIEDSVNYGLNCVRVGIVEEFYPDTLTAQIKIANKMLVGLNDDGSQVNQDYAPIYAKVHFIGWGGTGATYPIEKGMEGILIFCDREIESWYINGDVNPLSYERAHDLSDSIFICGIHSIPNMIKMLTDCFHIFYKSSDLQIKDKAVIINSDNVTINANTTINGNLIVNGNISTTGTITASQTITSDVDVVAGGISLKSHTHICATAGNPSGLPQ